MGKAEIYSALITFAIVLGPFVVTYVVQAWQHRRAIRARLDAIGER